MPAFEIEMLWDCPSCDTDEIGGTIDSCPSCGAAHDTKASPWYMPGDVSYKARIQDARKLRMAKAGPNRTCPNCGGTQRRYDGHCVNCSAPLDEVSPAETDEHPEADRVLSRPIPPQSAQEGYGSVAENVEVGSRWPNFMLIVGLVIAVAAALVLIWSLFRQEMVTITVSGVQWIQTVSVERYRQKEQGGFREDMPTDAENVREVGKKIHHYVQVLDHIETEEYEVAVQDGETCVSVPKSCKTTPVECKDNGNGVASCQGDDEVCTGGGKDCTPKYRKEKRKRNKEVFRDDPVYAMNYAWTVWRWEHQRDVRRSGSTTETSWPSEEEICLGCRVGPGEKERVSGKDATYEVQFLDVNGTDEYKYEPKSEEEFHGFTLNSEHRALYSIAGGLEFQAALATP